MTIAPSSDTNPPITLNGLAAKAIAHPTVLPDRALSHGTEAHPHPIPETSLEDM